MADDTEGLDRRGLGRRKFLLGSAAAAGGAALAAGGVVPAAASPAPGATPDYGRASSLGTPARPRSRAVPRRQTRIGIGYETWFDAIGWGRPEAEPILGRYTSHDPAVIRQHAEWITYAGIDHIVIDWSNNLGGNWDNANQTAKKIIAGTDALLEVYATMPQRSRPDVTLLLGTDDGKAGTPHFVEQVELVKSKYLANPAYRRMFVQHDGKPLLTFYGVRGNPPDWNDPAFTVRWMSAFREILLSPGGVWSWVDRLGYANGPWTPLSDFAGSGFGAWSADPAWAIKKVKTQPAFNVSLDATIATTEPADGAAQPAGTLTGPVFTIDERTLAFNVIGFDMSAGSDLPNLDGRNVYLLKDAASGTILRHEVPPGDSTRLYPRQWNVADLVGRKVVFQAVNNSTMGGLGWCGFDGLWQQRCEQMTAVVANPGNEGPGSFHNWDAHLRNSGGYLVQMMASAFDYEPEFLLVQQWNEFGRPDQFSIVGGNDIEPTKITKLAGANSDGYGFYYLKLVRDLVDQYRAGKAFPAVTLDTRYP